MSRALSHPFDNKLFRNISRWWDSHCIRCGLCCYEKIRQENGSWVLELSRPCPWLNTETKLCKVYKQRLKIYPGCRRITVFRALFATYLPPSCGYVRKFRPRLFPSSQVVISETVE